MVEYNVFRMSAEEELSKEDLYSFIMANIHISTHRYMDLKNAYCNRYEIFRLPKKPKYKPDNRLSVNFAKYITDTFNGFFIGIPVKTQCDDSHVAEYAALLDTFNNQDDKNAELSKLCSIYGRAYELYYVNSENMICISYLPPTQAFMIYDDSVNTNPKYFVRYYFDADKNLHGSISDSSRVWYFYVTGGTVRFEDEEGELHGFDGVPAVEFYENEERIGLYEGALSMMNEYNKALSEKANDIDYFADAYMKVIGPDMNSSDVANIRDNRVINIPAQDGVNGDADFLAKPNADTSQENLLNRLEREIFVTCMVANINDENFDAASGLAMRYRLTIMSDLAKTKQRKFTAGFNKRYRLIFSNPVSQMAKDDWMKLRFQFTLNYPVNLTEEADVASKLKGITSDETLLSVLSIVDDVKAEIERKQKENDRIAYQTDYETARTTLNNE